MKRSKYINYKEKFPKNHFVEVLLPITNLIKSYWYCEIPNATDICNPHIDNSAFLLPSVENIYILYVF